jgi:hypothetical protein
MGSIPFDLGGVVQDAVLVRQMRRAVLAERSFDEFLGRAHELAVFIQAVGVEGLQDQFAVEAVDATAVFQQALVDLLAVPQFLDFRGKIRFHSLPQYGW